jgi:quercetin dioxygenase-like cupin family protein
MSVQQHARLLQQEEVRGLDLVDGGTLQWLVDQSLGAQHVMAYRMTLDSDSRETHVHTGTEEVLYVVQGKGEIQIEGRRQVVHSGQAVYIPEGAEHAYCNTGDQPLVIVGAMAPPIDPDEVRPVLPRLDLAGIGPTAIDEASRTPTMMDEGRVQPTMMGERSFRVLVSPQVGCRKMTQFTGVIPTGRAPLHAHPYEEATYILAGHGRLWIEEDAVGELRPGSMIFFPIGVRHTMENTGSEDMKVLGAFSPANSPDAKLPPG